MLLGFKKRKEEDKKKERKEEEEKERIRNFLSLNFHLLLSLYSLYLHCFLRSHGGAIEYCSI